MAFAALLLMGTTQTSSAQTEQAATTTQQLTEQAQATTPAGEAVLHKEIKRLFIEGGAGFMGSYPSLPHLRPRNSHREDYLP